MRIEIKYSRSQGPHLIELSHEEIKNMITSQNLIITQSTDKGGEKTITFSGTKEELSDLATALNSKTDD